MMMMMMLMMMIYLLYLHKIIFLCIISTYITSFCLKTIISGKDYGTNRDFLVTVRFLLLYSEVVLRERFSFATSVKARMIWLDKLVVCKYAIEIT